MQAAIECPDHYLVEYFDELRNQIDIACQLFINEKNDEAADRAIKLQEEMIIEVKKFQDSCLDNLPSLAVENSSEEGLLSMQKRIFLNRSILFESTKDIEADIKSADIVSRIAMFGILRIVDDEFLSKEK